MADDRGRGLPPPRDLRDDPNYPPPPQGDEDDRSRPYQPHRPGMGLTLPSIHDSINAYGQPPPPSRYPPAHHADPRASGSYGPSPAGTNGYSAPPPGPTAPPQQPPYLPPVHDGRPPQPGYPPDPYARPAYPQGYDYRQPPGPYGPDRGYPPDYGRGPVPNAPAMQPGAPRQRTSIACKYCRRRKIRCSGYANAPGGKCTNCVKMNQECIFQPVSTSAAATAFVPISAVQGNLPPGTPMYGAYGQPLPHAPPAPPAHYPPVSGEYPPHPMQSPTAPYPPAPSYGEHDRRRPREDDHMPPRLPPPNHPYQEDPRRRSPATPSTNSPGAYSSYPPPTAGYDGGGSTPTQRGSPGGTAPNQSSAGPGGAMSLANIMDGPPRADATREIDQDMLGRLNRRPQ